MTVPPAVAVAEVRVAESKTDPARVIVVNCRVVVIVGLATTDKSSQLLVDPLSMESPLYTACIL